MALVTGLVNNSLRSFQRADLQRNYTLQLYCTVDMFGPSLVKVKVIMKSHGVMLTCLSIKFNSVGKEQVLGEFQWDEAY